MSLTILILVKKLIYLIYRCYDIGISPDVAQRELVAERYAEPMSVDQGMRSASSSFIPINQNADRTRADFFPAFFDVNGDGSCFLYSILYNSHTHPHSSPKGLVYYDEEEAMGVRNRAVDQIRDVVRARMDEYAAMRVFMGELMGAASLVDDGKEFIDEDSRIKSSIIANLNIDSISMITNEDGDIIESEVNELLKKLRLKRTWADAPLMAQIARSFPHNITIITVPREWARRRGPRSQIALRDRECNVNDQSQSHGYDRSIISGRASLADKTIIVLFVGGHYMRVVFLNTMSHSLSNPMVIIEVPTWQRHEWVDRIARYWGMHPHNFVRWRSATTCGYRGCQMRLGHGDGHSESD